MAVWVWKTKITAPTINTSVFLIVFLFTRLLRFDYKRNCFLSVCHCFSVGFYVLYHLKRWNKFNSALLTLFSLLFSCFLFFSSLFARNHRINWNRRNQCDLANVFFPALLWFFSCSLSKLSAMFHYSPTALYKFGFNVSDSKNLAI